MATAKKTGNKYSVIPAPGVTVTGGPTENSNYANEAKDAYWDIEIKRGNATDKFTVKVWVGGFAVINSNEMAQISRLERSDGTRNIWNGLIVR